MILECGDSTQGCTGILDQGAGRPATGRRNDWFDTSRTPSRLEKYMNEAYLEKMRGEGAEHSKLSHFVGSILRTLIADDRAAEAA